MYCAYIKRGLSITSKYRCATLSYAPLTTFHSSLPSFQHVRLFPVFRCIPRSLSSHLDSRNGLMGPVSISAVPHLFNSLRTFTSTDESARREFILIEKKENGTALVRLNRPKALNALCDQLCNELVDSLKQLDQDDDVRAIVLTGNEKAFAAGADIRQMKDRTFATASKMDMLCNWDAIQKIRKPIIAAVNGYALGGGCELAMMCDIIIAGSKAKFGQPEILIGTMPGMGGSQRLTRAVGKSKAMELILTGRQFDAQEALQYGLVSRVVDCGVLEEEALKLAESIAKFSLPAIVACKESVNRSFESSLQEGLLFERRNFHATFATEDRLEGMTAFSEKREPQWKHR